VAALLVVCGVCHQVQANDSGSTFVLEANGGWQGPIGYGGLALVYDQGGMLSAGFGIGIDAESSDSFPPVGVFGRVRALRAGPFALGLAVTLSRGHYGSAREYSRMYYTWEDLRWTWEPGYRATGAVAAELAGQRWSLRVEGGVGYLLNQPRCTYHTTVDYYDGSCDSPAIPAAYHFAVQPGRVLPTVTASVGYRFGVVDHNADGWPVSPFYRSPSTALQLPLFSTLGSLALGTGLLYASQGHSGSSQTGAIAAFTLGLSIAPATGHLYAGEYGRALLTTTVRVAAGALAAWVFMNSIPKDCSPGECHTQFGSEGPVLAIMLALVVPATAVNDIADAPGAARRANERHGLQLALVPVLASGGPVPQRGLALAGQF
jgi:hypothetical protein